MARLTQNFQIVRLAKERGDELIQVGERSAGANMIYFNLFPHEPFAASRTLKFPFDAGGAVNGRSPGR